MNDHLAFINAQKLLGSCNVETSNRCPLRCPQCTRAKLLLPKDSNKYKEIKARINSGDDLQIIDALKLLDFFKRGVFLCGQLSDPVYWPNLFEFLKLSNNYLDRTISLHIAASQKNIEWYKSAFGLCGKNIIWKFGIDGMEDTGPIYRVGQNSKLMFEAMLLGKAMGISIEWHYIVFQHNVHQLDEARLFAKLHNIPLHLVKSNRSGGGVEIPIKWKPNRNKEIINDSI
jgi:glutaredoxin